MSKNKRLVIQTVVIPVLLLVLYIMGVYSLHLGILGNISMAFVWVFLHTMYLVGVYCYNCMRNNTEMKNLKVSEQQLNQGG